jgi:hypothetical protein
MLKHTFMSTRLSSHDETDFIDHDLSSHAKIIFQPCPFPDMLKLALFTTRDMVKLALLATPLYSHVQTIVVSVLCTILFLFHQTTLLQLVSQLFSSCLFTCKPSQWDFLQHWSAHLWFSPKRPSQFCEYDSGVDRVDSNLVWPKFECHDLGHHVHCGL